MEKLSAHSLIKITGMASVQGTDQLWNDDDNIIVQKPPLDVNVRSETVEFLVSIFHFFFKFMSPKSRSRFNQNLFK